MQKNTTDKTIFYVSDLAGNLIQKVIIQEDGVGLVEKMNLSNTSARAGDCYQTIFSTCSQGNHSFAYGNAGNCIYWSQSGGTPPSAVSYPTACGDGSGYHDNGDTGNLGGGNGNSNGEDGISISPTGGGPGDLNSSLTDSDCISGLDCEDCDLTGDVNNNCVIEPFEACIVLSETTNLFNQLDIVSHDD